MRTWWDWTGTAVLLAALAAIAASTRGGPPGSIWVRTGTGAMTLEDDEGGPVRLAVLTGDRPVTSSDGSFFIAVTPLDRPWSELLRDLGLARDDYYIYWGAEPALEA